MTGCSRALLSHGQAFLRRGGERDPRSLRVPSRCAAALPTGQLKVTFVHTVELAGDTIITGDFYHSVGKSQGTENLYRVENKWVLLVLLGIFVRGLD